MDAPTRRGPEGIDAQRGRATAVLRLPLCHALPVSFSRDRQDNDPSCPRMDAAAREDAEEVDAQHGRGVLLRAVHVAVMPGSPPFRDVAKTMTRHPHAWTHPRGGGPRALTRSAVAQQRFSVFPYATPFPSRFPELAKTMTRHAHAWTQPRARTPKRLTLSTVAVSYSAPSTSLSCPARLLFAMSPRQ